jgi:Tfp pilus assembly protein PilP
MKLTTGIVALALVAGSAWAQNPNVINNTKTALQGAAQNKATDINAVLNAPAPAKPPAAAPGKPAPAAKPVAAGTPNAAPQATPSKASSGKATASAAAAPAKPAKVQAAPKLATEKKDPMKPVGTVAAKPAEKTGPATETAKAENQEDKKYSMTGKRDPFISPVVSRQGGSGCSTGKKCLDIEQLAVRGVVKSDNGMIAVVTNGLNKAYFLRENDPVFNGYVVKITGDSVVFKETFQDRLGKPFTRDVVKKITTPAV